MNTYYPIIKQKRKFNDEKKKFYIYCNNFNHCVLDFIFSMESTSIGRWRNDHLLQPDIQNICVE